MARLVAAPVVMQPAILPTVKNMAIMAILEGAMRSVNIAELKNRLSAYLDEVRAGEEIMIRDRNQAIAKIVPLSLADFDAAERALIASGEMRPPERPLPTSFWAMPAPRVPMRRIRAVIAAEREER